MSTAKEMMEYYLGGTGFVESFNVDTFGTIFGRAIWQFALVMAPIFGVGLVIAILSNYIQVGYLFSTKAIQPKLSRMNPIEGFKKMFSLKALYELAKAAFKLIVIGVIVYMQVERNLQVILSTMHIGMEEAIASTFDIIISTAFVICIAIAVFAAIDYVYQWFKYEKDLKMTKYEVKTEFKQMEGDPQIKSKRQAIHRKLAVARMMQSVPDADVVITNPTHFAVAIKYDKKKADAPIVVALGQDRVALRIKEIAREHNVEIVENKMVARALYSACEIGSQIPLDLYQAVAEILAYVYRIKNGVRNR